MEAADNHNEFTESTRLTAASNGARNSSFSMEKKQYKTVDDSVILGDNPWWLPEVHFRGRKLRGPHFALFFAYVALVVFSVLFYMKYAFPSLISMSWVEVCIPLYLAQLLLVVFIVNKIGLFMESELYDDNMDVSIGNRAKLRFLITFSSWVAIAFTLFLSIIVPEITDKLNRKFSKTKDIAALKVCRDVAAIILTMILAGSTYYGYRY